VPQCELESNPDKAADIMRADHPEFGSFVFALLFEENI
jgi:hypothetical protein